MMTDKHSDLAVAPGNYIQEILAANNISDLTLAISLELSLPEIQKLLDGQRPITAELAQKLETALDVPAIFWLRLEHQFQATKLGQLQSVA